MVNLLKLVIDKKKVKSLLDKKRKKILTLQVNVSRSFLVLSA